MQMTQQNPIRSYVLMRELDSTGREKAEQLHQMMYLCYAASDERAIFLNPTGLSIQFPCGRDRDRGRKYCVEVKMLLTFCRYKLCHY